MLQRARTISPNRRPLAVDVATVRLRPFNNSTKDPRVEPVEGTFGLDYERLFSDEFADRSTTMIRFAGTWTGHPMSSTFKVRTSCAFDRDGTGQTALYTGQKPLPYLEIAPDCGGPWLVWWRQNMPGLDNAARDNLGLPMLNWWPFVFY
jgi:hypothetical protein